MTIPAHYVPSRKAAEMYGCSQPNLVRMMRRYGYAPLVEQVGGPHGGTVTRYGWDPTNVLMAKRESRRRKVVSDTKNITRYNDLPSAVREAMVKSRRMERLRRYYQQKAASRAAA